MKFPIELINTTTYQILIRFVLRIIIDCAFERERIIEYCLPSADGALAKQSVKDFVMNVAGRSPAPGGGSVSALLGALVNF
jgi:hypothetical protein